MNGTEEAEHNDQFQVKDIIRMRKILARGIRKPEQILEDMRIIPEEETKIVSLNL